MATCITAAHCDHILGELGDSKCATYGIRKAVNLLKDIYSRRASDVVAVLNSATCPFPQDVRRCIERALDEGARPVDSEMYMNFKVFAYWLSRRRYLPTSELEALLPKLEIGHQATMEIALTLPDINPASIRRVSTSGYVARTEHSMVVINRKNVIHAFSNKIWFKCALHALRWASSLEEFPEVLRVNPTNPPRGIAVRIASELLAAAKGKPDFSFYSKHLLPMTAEYITELYGTIKTTEPRVMRNHEGRLMRLTGDSPLASGTASESGEDLCVICYSSMAAPPAAHAASASRLGSQHVAILRCGHMLHAECHNLCVHHGYDSCPTCRQPLILARP
jgi:hypothetical protein